MNDQNKSPERQKVPPVVWILCGIVVLFILCVCVILILLLIYGWQLIYII